MRNLVNIRRMFAMTAAGSSQTGNIHNIFLRSVTYREQYTYFRDIGKCHIDRNLC